MFSIDSIGDKCSTQSEAFQRRTADATSGAIVVGQFGMLAFKTLKPFHEPVVIAIAQDGRGFNIIKAIMAADLPLANARLRRGAIRTPACSSHDLLS